MRRMFCLLCWAPAGAPLLANTTYAISFPEAPPQDPRAFWSLQVFDLTNLTYPGVGSDGYGTGYLALSVLTSLAANTSSDGSFKIILGPTKVGCCMADRTGARGGRTTCASGGCDS